MHRIRELFYLLSRFYDCKEWWPVHENTDPFLEISIGAILTQNTNWKNVERAVNNLIKEGLLNWEKLDTVRIEKLKECIRPAGFYNQKATYIKSFVRAVKDLPAENITRDFLLSIKGIGEETADSILLYGLGRPYFVVDAYTKRLFYRIGIIKKQNLSYRKVQEMVMEVFSADVHTYRLFHALIVEHCKEYCRKKPNCTECPIRNICRQNLK
ncbi:endonuclease [Persephonella atlantica]|uniref:Endonuclease n=1 Tax=Persephonella atlantica TaxID=2699429 RepID=A0ABS1GJQ6_9AQUI|nr:endonuclease [Persephonella atlantica]MBK3333145.1 endonuclease [Persephonella atlantica]